MSTSLSLLREQRRVVRSGISNSNSMIADIEEKIARLRAAVNDLQKSIGELETTKASIDGLTIDPSSWKGENKDTFEEQYSEYQDAVENYISKTEDAKETMENEIARLEALKASYITGLNNLQSTLTSLNSQISKAERA